MKKELLRVGFTFDTLDCMNCQPRSPQQGELVKVVSEFLSSDCRLLTVLGMQGRGKSWGVAMGVQPYVLRYEEEIGNAFDKYQYLTHYELDLSYKSCMNPSSRITQVDCYKHFTEKPVLIIDEFLKGAKTPYALDFVENVINKRHAMKRKTILITNHTTKELATMLDPTIMDRLGNGNTGQMFVLTGESLR